MDMYGRHHSSFFVAVCSLLACLLSLVHPAMGISHSPLTQYTVSINPLILSLSPYVGWVGSLLPRRSSPNGGFIYAALCVVTDVPFLIIVLLHSFMHHRVLMDADSSSSRSSRHQVVVVAASTSLRDRVLKVNKAMSSTSNSTSSSAATSAGGLIRRLLEEVKVMSTGFPTTWDEDVMILNRLEGMAPSRKLISEADLSVDGRCGSTEDTLNKFQCLSVLRRRVGMKHTISVAHRILVYAKEESEGSSGGSGGGAATSTTN